MILAVETTHNQDRYSGSGQARSLCLSLGYKIMNKITLAILIFLSALPTSLYSQENGKQKYTLPYSAPGEHKGISEIYHPIQNDKAKEFITLAKIAAKEAGYPLTGKNLDKYLYNNEKYNVTETAEENTEYISIFLTPDISKYTKKSDGSVEAFVVTCNFAEIIIHKKTKTIISILPGP